MSTHTQTRVHTQCFGFNVEFTLSKLTLGNEDGSKFQEEKKIVKMLQILKCMKTTKKTKIVSIFLGGCVRTAANRTNAFGEKKSYLHNDDIAETNQWRIKLS